MRNMTPEEIIKGQAWCQAQRSNLETVLDDIERYVVPYRGEFLDETKSETTVDWQRTEIYDSTAIVSNDALASQMQGYITNPSGKFFGFEFRDDDLNDDMAAREWLEECESQVWQAISESDFDTESAEMYLDLPSFGTAFIFMEEEGADAQPYKGIDFTSVPVDDSFFEAGPDGVVYRYYRALRYKWEELDARFDIPESVDRPNDAELKQDKDYHVIFCVYRRNDEDPMQMMRPEDRPIGYQYVLKGEAITLEEGGYYHMPVMVPRWGLTAGSDWGHSPAMRALSDIKQLNETVALVTEARAKAVDPPVLGTEMALLGDISLASGELTVVTDIDGLKPFHTFSNFVEADKEIARLQEAIRDAFYLPRLEYKDSPQMTAHEVERRHQRMLRLMAPMLGRLKRDLLAPVIMNTFYILARKGELPEAPPVVGDADLDIVYKGELPRAQEQDVAVAIQDVMTLVAEFGEAFPSLRDRLDEDAALRELTLIRGAPTKILRTDDEVEEIKRARNEQQQQVAQLQQAQMAGEAMKAAGEGKAAADAAGVPMPENVTPMRRPA